MSVVYTPQENRKHYFFIFLIVIIFLSFAFIPYFLYARPTTDDGVLSVDGGLWVWDRVKFNDYQFPLSAGDTNQILILNSDNNLSWTDYSASGGTGDCLWDEGSLIGTIKYQATSGNSYVGINTEPTTHLDVSGNIKSSGTVEVGTNLSITDYTGMNMNPVSNVPLSIKPKTSNGQNGLRLYDYLSNKYSEIAFGRSGTDTYLDFWVDSSRGFRIDKGNDLTTSYYPFTASRAYFPNDYDAKLNSNNQALGFLKITCKDDTHTISNLNYHTILVETDGKTDCDVTLPSYDDYHYYKFAIKNIDDTYNVNLKTYDDGELIDVQWNASNPLVLKPFKSHILHVTEWDRDTWMWTILSSS